MIEILNFRMWLLRMWLEGYGSYEAIYWAIRWHILKPFEIPGRSAKLRKWLIRVLYKGQNEEGEE